MQTKNGIEFDLKQSKYIYKIGDFTFYFSSEFYLKKFKNELFEFDEMERSKFLAKYKININLFLYFAFALYRRIEKRGFYITKNNKELEHIYFDIILKQ